MFTIKTIRVGACDDCHVVSNGVEFVLERAPEGQAFLCWKHFRMTLEAMRVASMVPEGGGESSLNTVDGFAQVPPPSRRAGLADPRATADGHSTQDESVRQDFLHGESKGGTDVRDTGGEG